MKKTIAILISILLLMLAAGCKPEAKTENITFAATITGFEDDGTLVYTSADVGFDTALVHFDENCKPDFTLAEGQTVQLTILPMMTKSIPPQVTAVSIALIAEATDHDVSSVTDGLDPMPMLTPGTEPVTDAETPDTVEAHIADMHPILDAITTAMGIEGEQGYMPADPLFVWSVLKALSEDWAQTSSETTLTDDTITIPQSVMASWALAAFHRTDALPEIPEAMSGRVQYDAEKEAYTVKKESISNDSHTGVDAWTESKEGGYAVTLGFYQATGERLGGIEFELTDTPTENGIYRYCVTNATVEPR